MTGSSHPAGNLSEQEKMLLARGARLDSGAIDLETLIALASDSSPAVRQTANETLGQLTDSECARLLESASSDAVLGYFLDSAHLRPALLPALLQHPSVPADVLINLARTAGQDLFPQFLAHLELLKSPVLMALKENPIYVERQKARAASTTPWAGPLDPIEDHERLVEQQRLARLVAVAKDSEGEERRSAIESLARTSDADFINAMAASSLDESLARYFLAPAHLRTALVPLLLGHPDSPQDAIVGLAAQAGPDIVPVLLDQLDQLHTPALIALKDNPTYLLWQKQPHLSHGYVLEVDLLELLIQEMEEQKPATVEELEAALADVDLSAADDEQIGLVKKIARMKVAQRVKLALLGTREERSMLIRDTSRVVFRAVLGSPKLTDFDVEGFATMKNVSQEVLRLISMSRRFMKNYTIVKNLAMNPRTPIDVSLPLLNRLLPNDLRAVASSRDVPDTLRKMAQKLQRSRAPSNPY